MIRPPPLQLKLDNRFPQPVRTPSQPKSKSFVSQLYKASWKNPIIAVAGLNSLRYAFAAHTAFQDAIVDDAEAADTLFKVSIALGAMYVVSFLIEIYGIIGVSLQRLSLVRIYLYLTFLASILVIGAGVLKGVSYFIFAEDLMWECMSLATEGRGYEKSLFRNRPWPGSVFPVSARVARKQCISAWVVHSWSQVLSVFLFSLVPAVVYYVMVYTYCRQTRDPGHHANLLRNSMRNGGGASTGRITGGNRRTGNGRDDGYSRVANGSREEGISTSRVHHGGTNLPSARHRTTATRSLRGTHQSIPGPSYANAHSISHHNLNRDSISIPTSKSTTTSLKTGKSQKRTFTPRSLVRPHRPPPLVASPSPLGFGFFGSSVNPHLQVIPVNNTNANGQTNAHGRVHPNTRAYPNPNVESSTMSPGPPTYGHVYGQSRVYAAFAAPLGEREYNQFL